MAGLPLRPTHVPSFRPIGPRWSRIPANNGQLIRYRDRLHTNIHGIKYICCVDGGWRVFAGKSASRCSFVPLFFAHRGRRAFTKEGGDGERESNVTRTWDDYHSRIVGRENDERNSARQFCKLSPERRGTNSPPSPSSTFFATRSPLFSPSLPFHPRERICPRDATCTGMIKRAAFHQPRMDGVADKRRNIE